MGLKNSKSIKLLKEQGLRSFIVCCLHKSVNALKKRSVVIVLRIYPKLVLNKTQYRAFTSAYKHFSENYKNIIAISPLFFIKHLKEHIAWIESDVFQHRYGDISDLESLYTRTIAKECSILTSSIYAQNESISNNSYATPPPPLCRGKVM